MDQRCKNTLSEGKRGCRNESGRGKHMEELGRKISRGTEEKPRQQGFTHSFHKVIEWLNTQC
jgi:hypothetical protein